MGPIPLLDRYDPPRPETQIHQKINVELNSLVTFNGVFRANYNEHPLHHLNGIVFIKHLLNMYIMYLIPRVLNANHQSQNYNNRFIRIAPYIIIALKYSHSWTVVQCRANC